MLSFYVAPDRGRCCIEGNVSNAVVVGDEHVAVIHIGISHIYMRVEHVVKRLHRMSDCFRIRQAIWD